MEIVFALKCLLRTCDSFLTWFQSAKCKYCVSRSLPSPFSVFYLAYVQLPPPLREWVNIHRLVFTLPQSLHMPLLTLPSPHNFWHRVNHWQQENTPFEEHFENWVCPRFPNKLFLAMIVSILSYRSNLCGKVVVAWSCRNLVAFSTGYRKLNHGEGSNPSGTNEQSKR